MLTTVSYTNWFSIWFKVNTIFKGLETSFERITKGCYKLPLLKSRISECIIISSLLNFKFMARRRSNRRSSGGGSRRSGGLSLGKILFYCTGAASVWMLYDRFMSMKR